MAFREFIDSLSDEQRAAAVTTDNPVMIIAGAGSGKTRTLVGRFMHLVAPTGDGGLGADPSSVMMVTFTNKAAREMRERIEPVVQQLREASPDQTVHDPWIGTFHGISLRILRVESARAGLSRNFSIFDEADARSLAEDVAEGLGLEAFDTDIFFADLELAKSRLLSAPLLAEKAVELDMKEAVGAAFTRNDHTWQKILQKFETPDFVNVYAAYQRALKDQNAVDFSDLMNTVTELFRADPVVRDSWRSTFRHFMVDEVQDMNRAQAAWLQAFTDGGKPMAIQHDAAHSAAASALDGMHEINSFRLRQFPRPTVAFVGDDDQSIYAFRGSDVSIMRSLSSRYEGLQIRFLNTSYRCQPGILSAANTLVSNNTGRFDKSIAPADPGRRASAVLISRHQTPIAEIKALKAEARRYLASGGDPSEFAILVRTRDLVRVIAKEFRADGLPIVEGKASDIRNAAEIRDTMAFAGFLVNPDAETLLRRIINKPSRGMGPTSTSRVMRNARMKNISFIEELRSIMNGRVDLPEAAEPYAKAFVTAARDFGRMIVALRGDIARAAHAGAAIERMLEVTDYLPGLKRSALKAAGLGGLAGTDIMALSPGLFLRRMIEMDEAGEGTKKQPDGALDTGEASSMEDLVDKASAMSETARRIGNIALLIDQASRSPSLDAFIQEATLEMDQQDAQAGFRVMTIHASKGLEFDRVRLPFWNDGVMPHARGSQEGPEALEEERRLAYVAITRARETARISFAGDVSRAPFIRMRFARSSPFIDEILAAGRPAAQICKVANADHPAFHSRGAFNDHVPPPHTAPSQDGAASAPRPRQWTPSTDDVDIVARILGKAATPPPRAEPEF